MHASILIFEIVTGGNWDRRDRE